MLREGNVKLIGEPFNELQLNPAGGAMNPGGPTAPAGPGPGGVGVNAGPIAQPGPMGQLANQLLDPNATFARIYGFSFEGHYYDLPRPVIMLVHGPGIALAGPPPAAPSPILDTDQAARTWEFSDNLFQWNYDKKTMSIRLDLDSGTIEQILLERCLGGGPGAYGAAVSGAAVSGAGAYGAGAYGAAVSGAGAYGAGAFGAGAFGAGAFGRGRRGGD